MCQRLPRACPAARCWADICADYRRRNPVRAGRSGGYGEEGGAGGAAQELCLRFAAALGARGAALVFGAESARQAANNADFLRVAPLSGQEIARIHNALAPHLCDNIINPALWNA